MQHAFTTKMAKYEERCAWEGIVFLPLAADTFGGWHEVALEVFKQLGQQVARHLPLNKHCQKKTSCICCLLHPIKC